MVILIKKKYVLPIVADVRQSCQYGRLNLGLLRNLLLLNILMVDAIHSIGYVR